MFQENGEEVLVHFEKEGMPYYISVDQESYARMLNDGYVVVEEMMPTTRPPIPEEFDMTPRGTE